jgi:hypothetical protein
VTGPSSGDRPDIVDQGAFLSSFDDRQHRMSPDCWCKPVERDGGWWHNNERMGR